MLNNPLITPFTGSPDPLAGLAANALSGTATVAPPTPAPAPTSPALVSPSPDAGSHLSRLQQVLRVAIPAIATAIAIKRGTGLGDFAQSFDAVQQQRRAEHDRQQQADELRQYRQITLDREARDEQRLQDRDQQLADQATQAAADRKAAQASAAIDTAVASVASHYNGLIPANVAERTSVDVPGLGRVNLHAALQHNHYAADADGNYYVGKAVPDKTVPYSFVDQSGNTVTQMVPSTDPRLGQPHITRRPTPKTPKEPKEPTVTFTDGMGKVQTLKRSQVRDLLRQAGYQNDDASLDRVMANPQAVSKLTGAGVP